MRLRSAKRRSGFTLIEILIVMVIIGLLAAILLPNFIRAKYRAYLSASEHNLRALAAAMESYSAEEGIYPPGGQLDPSHVLFTSDHMKPSDVTDPSNGSRYELLSSGDNYTLITHANHHLVFEYVAIDHPQYTPTSGLILAP